MPSSDPPPATTSSSSSTTTRPWGPAKPYLLGTDGHTGIFPSAENFFNQFGTLNDQQQGLNNNYFDTLSGRQGDITNMQGVGQNLIGGQYDPTAGPINLAQGWGDLGGADPTAALQRSLSGNADNPYLQGMHQANINASLRGYDDAIQNLTQNVLPGIGDQAFASGQYGSSRQGVAEGMAVQQAQRNARDLGVAAMDAGNQLYGSAYENAQGRMANTAQYLGGLAGQNQQFNANLDLQQSQAGAQNALQGLGALQNTFTSADNVYNQQQSLLSAPQQQYQNALNQYANIISPGAALGGASSSSQSIPVYSNSTGQLIGGGLGLAGLLSSFGG